MKGSSEIITRLNRLLVGELSSSDQYFVHSQMYRNWGFQALFARIDHEREEELQHARALIERILFLEGTPDGATARNPLKIGKTVPEMLRNDLDLEYAVIAELKEVMALCERQQDFQTREILRGLLADSEVDHAYWLEIQLRLIESMGLANYLQSAARDIAGSPA